MGSNETSAAKKRHCGLLKAMKLHCRLFGCEEASLWALESDEASLDFGFWVVIKSKGNYKKTLIRKHVAYKNDNLKILKKRLNQSLLGKVRS